MTKAVWSGTVIAESDRTEILEGNHYFPPDAVHREFLRESDTTTRCAWKGTANYYDVVVGDAVNKNAAWYYASPKPDAAKIAGHVAFWRGVEIEE